MNEERNLFYALLYLSGKPIPTTSIKDVIEPFDIENKLLNFVDYFNSLDLGLTIRYVANGYQMTVDNKLYEICANFFNIKGEKLSKSSKETLSIIAYNGPITKQEIEFIRGVNSSGTIKHLLDRNLVKIAGRKDVPGKPLLYSITDYFFEYFGLQNLAELPTLREWQELKSNK